MKTSHVATLVAYLSTVTALPSSSAPPGHEYKAPGSGDVRSPCPGLNSLANHGFLPRSGKGMTIPILNKGMKEGMNIGPDFALAIGGAGLLAKGSPAPNAFDLNDLDEHNFPIEHDGSLSRQDKYFGQDHKLVPRSYNMFMEPYKGFEKTSLQLAANARWGRINDSLTRNPTVTYGPREFIFSYGETALYLQVMGESPHTSVAEVSYVKSLFEDERLPYHLGWKKPEGVVNLQTLGTQVLELFQATGEELPEGLEVVTEGTYRDALALLGVFNNSKLNGGPKILKD